MSPADDPQQLAVAAVDPGRSKSGLVLSDPGRRRVVQAAVLPTAAALKQLQRWCAEPGLATVVLGNGTGSAVWQAQLATLVPVVAIDERGSTLAARQRYWELMPPRGWRRLLPAGLRLPPGDIDDVVAQLLLERWLGWSLQRQADSRLRTTPAP